MLVRIVTTVKSSERKKVTDIDLSAPDKDLQALATAILVVEKEFFNLKDKIAKCSNPEECEALKEELKRIKPTKKLIIFGFDNNLEKPKLLCNLIASSQHIETLVLGRPKPGNFENEYFNAAGPDENHLTILISGLASNNSIRKLKLRAFPEAGLLEKVAFVFVEQARASNPAKLRSLKIDTTFVEGSQTKISNFYLFAQTLASNRNFLTYLHLAGSRINDKDMEILTGLGCSPTSLGAIKISSSSVTDQGAHILDDLTFLTPISINLEGSSITAQLRDRINVDGNAEKLNEISWEQLKQSPHYFSLLPREIIVNTQTFYTSTRKQVTDFFKTPSPQQSVAQSGAQTSELNLSPA